MIAALLRKELRTQAPFLAFVVLMVGLEPLAIILDGYANQAHLRPVLSALASHGSDADLLFLVVLAFAMGSSLLIRERDERTIEHLDALPVSRAAIFAVKVGLALVVIGMVPLTRALIAVVRWHVGSTSLFPALALDWIVTAALLQLVQAALLLSVGLVLGFAGRFAWAVMATVCLVVATLLDRHPELGWLHPLQLTRPAIVGDTWRVPTRSLVATLAITAACGALALFLFARMGDRLFVRREIPRRWLAAVAVTVTLIVCTVLIARVSRTDRSPAPGTVSFPSGAPVKAQTRHYALVYPGGIARRGEALLSRADEVHDVVIKRLHIAPGEVVPIVVDTAGSAAGTAGTARNNTIRVDLTQTDDLARHLAVLGHETTHVYINALSRDRVTDARWGGFFHEGLASFVEYAELRPPEDLVALRAVAFVARARHPLQLEAVMDRELLATRYDADLVYALGESFFAVLVHHHGPDAPARVLRAMAREGVRENLSGLERYRDAFQAARLDLDAVASDWLAYLEGGREVAAHFPRILGVPEVEAERVIVRFDVEPPSGYRAACRFRRRDDAPTHEYLELTDVDMSACWISRRRLSGRTVDYQLGFRENGSTHALWEPWSQVSLD